MKKKIVLSVVALVYISLFKITNFETGDVGSATILIYFGVPFFILLSLILFIVNSYYCFKEKFTIKSLYFVSLIVNFISLTLIYEVFLFFLNPLNW